MREDLTQPFELVFKDGLEQGLIDRPVEIVFREVEGLPKGTIKAVIDALRRAGRRGMPRRLRAGDHRQHGPDQGGDRGALPRPGDELHRDRRVVRGVDLRAPAGLDDRRADLLGRPHRQGGPHRRSARSSSSRWSASPTSRNFRRACARARHPDRGRGVDPADRAGHRRRRCGRCTTPSRRPSCTAASASGSCSSTWRWPSSTGIRLATWAPPSRTRGSTRSCGTRSSAGPASTSTTRATWSARRFLDQYEADYGRRPPYCVPVMNRDFATVLLHAFANAHPLTPRGVRDALETGEDDPGRRRRARHLPLVRQVDPSRVDGRRLPGRPPARSRRRQLAPRRTLRRSVMARTVEDRDRLGARRLPEARQVRERKSILGGIAWGVFGFGLFAFVVFVSYNLQAPGQMTRAGRQPERHRRTSAGHAALRRHRVADEDAAGHDRHGRWWWSWPSWSCGAAIPRHPVLLWPSPAPPSCGWTRS